MELLKKEYWWVWLLFEVFGQGVGIYILAAFVHAYDKNAWYTKWQYWLIGCLLLFIPALIMFIVFTIQITVNTAKKLDVPGYEIYTSPYIWILCLIIPVIGWIVFSILNIYLTIYILVALYRGNGEKYIG